ncbi:hypothetical protein MXB_3346 [Myxobolus squamalis]|nr:hypothetical protein MXB_3346 [Myxobolus squamalis]
MNRVHGEKLSYTFRERRPKLYICEQCGLTFHQNIIFKDHILSHKNFQLHIN